MKNPILEKDRLLIAYFGIWLLISIAQIVIETNYLGIVLSISIGSVLIYNLLYIGIAISIWYPVRYMSPEAMTLPRLIINHFASAVITSLIWLLIGYFIISNIFTLDVELSSYIEKGLVLRFVIGVLLYLVHASVYYLIIYSSQQKQKQLVESELRNLLKESELKQLKYQINPHFIFNSLNSIASLTISSPENARNMTIKLSSYLRGMLNKDDMTLHLLANEIENIRLYLEIEKVRFGQKLNFIESLKADCGKIKVPGMILQPIIENAVKYGLHESTETVNIEMKCEKRENYLNITISNNYDKEAVVKKGEGIGLKNIKQRLKLIYNEENLLTINDNGKEFIVNIFIPINKSER